MRRVILFVVLACATTIAADPRFSASDVAGARLRARGRVVITNTRTTVTAYQFFGNIRQALVTLRSTRKLAYNPLASVYASNAPVPRAIPLSMAQVVTEAARTHGVDPRLVAAVAGRESAWNPAAVSRVGAGGIMQLMPDTARYLGVTNVFDARENIFGGTRYLRTLLDSFHGDLDLTLAAYNAGPGAVQKYNGVPPFPETQAYVRFVRRAYEAALR